MRLKDRISIVTGAAQGIGAAIAREFAREGALVAALDRKGDVEKVCEDIRCKGGQATGYVLDITDQEAYRSCVDRVASQSGRIDTLVNNAAVWRPGDIFTDKLDEWREVQKINLEAVYWGCKLVAPHMARQHRGRIITITFGSGVGHRWRCRRLCGGERRSGQLHEIAGSRTCDSRRACQRDRSGFHSYAHVNREWS